MASKTIGAILVGLLCLTGVRAVKDVPVIQVVTLVDQPTYLPCDITPGQDGDAVHLILWFRGDRSSSAIYSVDARERSFMYADHWSDEKVFSGRANFNRESQPAVLGVDRVREDDAGIYRCRVEFRVGQTRNSKVNLTVVVPPHKVTLMNENGLVLVSSVGPFLEGDDVRLLCDVHGGKPPPTISWYRNGRFVGNSSHRLKDGLTRSEIQLVNLGRRDANTEISCNATNNNRSAPASARVRLDMNFNPLTVTIEGANQPLSAGKRYDLVCSTSGSRPPAEVIWYKEKLELLDSKDTTSSDGNTTTSVLSFTPRKEDAGQRLFCRAKNPIMMTEPIEDLWTLEIQYIPETEIRLGTSLDPSSIKEGSDVYFDCLIQAEPPVYKVEWRHQGKSLNHNVSQGVIISNQSLVLQSVSRKNAGNYTCVGHNIEGDGESRPFYLNVMFAPTCKANQTTVHGVAKQEKASITCEVDANPPEVEFRWTFNNSAESIQLQSQHITRSGTTSTASYKPQIEMDYGTLLCWASNQIGRQQVPCVYSIIPAGRPDVVTNCSTANTSKTSFEVRCNPGFNGGIPQSFLLELRESTNQEFKANLTSEEPHFNVSELEPGTLYQVIVYAYNRKGRSEPVIVQAGTLSPPEKQLTSESERPRQPMRLTPMLSVMIGVVAALVIVAIIVMIVLRIQHSHVDEQHKSQVEDNGKPAKAVPIQRELRFRECDSLIGDEKNDANGPFGKLVDTITPGDLSESDEKNPDIIPQQITGEEVSEYLRKRRLISTIETSPSRGLLERSAVPSGVSCRGQNYVGYCTIRSSMPLRELSNATVKFKHKGQYQQPMPGDVCESGMCTLPRQHWPSHASASIPMTSLPPSVLYTAGSVAGIGGSVSVVRACPSGLSSHTCTDVAQCCVAVAPSPPPPPPGSICIQGSSSPIMMTGLPPPPPPAIVPILVTKRESSV